MSFLHLPLRSRAESISWASCGAFRVAHAGSKKKGSRQGMTTSEKFDPRPRFLMCRPRHFAVTYSINPWMNPAAWQESGDALHATAQRQWDGLFDALCSSGASVDLVEPLGGLPDLVFTANSAVVLDGKALLARFRYPQRQGEEPVYAAAFQALRSRGLIGEVVTLPPGVTLEGAGDCLWDAHRGCSGWVVASAREWRRARLLPRNSACRASLSLLPTQPSTTSTPVSVRCRVVP